MKYSFILKSAIWLCLFFCAAGVRAQFDARFGQYWAVPGYYHPAWAGQTENKLNIYGSYGMQLMGFTHAPRVMYFGADMPFTLFNKPQGAGVGFSMKPSVCSATSVSGGSMPINRKSVKASWASAFR